MPALGLRVKGLKGWQRREHFGFPTIKRFFGDPYNNAAGTCSRARKHARAQDSLALPVNSSLGR